jgi:hypothetical protein
MYVVDGKLTYDYISNGMGGVKAIVSGIVAGKVQVSVDGYANREIGTIVRYKSFENYITFVYDPDYDPRNVASGTCGGVMWFLYCGVHPPEGYYGQWTPAWPKDQPIPLRLTTSYDVALGYYSITDGTTTYYKAGDLSREMGLGDLPIVGGVGLAGDIAYSMWWPGNPQILPALYDNFLVEIPAVARSVAADSVQVIVPASVVPPDLQVGDFIKVVGIAGNGLADGGIRAVTVRQSDDLRKE